MEIVDIRDKSIALVRQGADPDPAVVEEAFRLWIENGRSSRLVASAIGCDRKTIERWSAKHNWEQRRAVEAHAFMPGKKIETAIALRLTAHNAAIRLQQISFDAIEKGIAPDLKEVDALTKMVAAGGYSSVGSRNPLDGLDSPQRQQVNPGTLSDDDIIRRELDLGVGRNG